MDKPRPTPEEIDAVFSSKYVRSYLRQLFGYYEYHSMITPQAYEWAYNEVAGLEPVLSIIESIEGCTDTAYRMRRRVEMLRAAITYNDAHSQHKAA